MSQSWEKLRRRTRAYPKQLRYECCSSDHIKHRIRAFGRYYALLRGFPDSGIIKSSLDRGAFTHPNQILRQKERDLLGSDRHQISLGYGPEAGEPLLRQRIAELENLRHGTRYREDNVAIVAGAWCGVELVFEELASVRRGSFRELRIASIGPTLYQLFQRPIEILGAKVFAFDFVKFEGSTPRTTDELEDILSCKPNVVFVTNPNNPVGEYFPSVLLKRLVEMCQSQAVTIVIDEMQNFLPVAGKGLGYGSWINAPHVVRVDSFSKHFGLAEYRIGWVIGDKKLIGDRYTGIIGRVKGLMGNAPRAANDTILSLLATQKELLCSKTATLPAQWTCLLNKEKYIARQLSYMPRVTVVPREGCFNLTMRIHCGKSDLEFAHRLIKAGTLIMPCEGYGYRSEDVVMRITFAERWQKIHHGIKVLRSVLEDKGL